jgi:hypothetical protein
MVIRDFIKRMGLPAPHGLDFLRKKQREKSTPFFIFLFSIGLFLVIG